MRYNAVRARTISHGRMTGPWYGMLVRLPEPLMGVQGCRTLCRDAPDVAPMGFALFRSDRLRGVGATSQCIASPPRLVHIVERSMPT